MKVNQGCFKVYTRQPDMECYPDGLAHSIHIAYKAENGEFHPLNKNYGMLFAKAEIAQNQTICPKGVKNPVRVCKKDGSWLAEDGITLDMTYIKTKRASYMVWSYRKDIATPLDTGSMLYIATIDEKEPWILTSNPVLLSRPLLGWENVAGTINNEGPYAFLKDDKVFLTYSGGSANGYTYAVGLFTANEEDDLLDISVWTKRNTPVVSFCSVDGEYGPGHNSFYIDEDGELMIAYHAEIGLQEHLRCDGIRRVHFREDGTPDFELTTEQELQESLRHVKMKLRIKAE